ncbi:MAG TPA: UDP-N-acetylmuramate dehydrogenase [Nitrospirota bacterium]|jgi:UDP-N-acetylmuramate dehydrogenase
MNAYEVIIACGFRGEVKIDEPMSKHTTLGIGGPADVMAYPLDVQDAAGLISAAWREGVQVTVTGLGSNLLVSDNGIRGIVLNTANMSQVEVDEETATVKAGAGAKLSVLVSRCADAGLAGMEFAAGIPGTVGGAVRMNAGTKTGEIKDVLLGVTVIGREGNIAEAKSEDMDHAYRKSSLPEGAIAATAVFKLCRGNPDELKRKIKEAIAARKVAQPYDVMSAGSAFKNPPGHFAWRLIDEAGMKGVSVGGAKVSEKHTNFLINTGNSTAKDFKSLMDKVVAAVKEKTGITLEPEIKTIGEI